MKMTTELALRFTHQMRDIQAKRQRIRKIVDWINKRTSAEYNWEDDLTDEDIQIWIKAIKDEDYTLLTDWTALHLEKDERARYRRDMNL